MISPSARRRPSSSIRQQSNDSELVASNSTASRFLGSRPKAWMQNINTAAGTVPVITRRPSRPLPAVATATTTTDTPGGSPSQAQSISDISKNTKNTASRSSRDTGAPTPDSEEPKDAPRDSLSTTQYLSPVASEGTLPSAVPGTIDPVQPAQQVRQPVQQPAQQPVQPLPSPNPSHKSDPTGTPRAEPVTAGVLAQPTLPADGRQTASPRRPQPPTIPTLRHDVPGSLGSPLVAAAAAPQSSVQCASGQDRHRDKRPRIAVSQPQIPCSQTSIPPPSSASPVNSGPVASGAGRTPPQIQQPPIDLSPQALESCVQSLNSALSVFQPQEAIYIYLLRDACMAYDLQYLALHQLHCIFAISSKPLSTLETRIKEGIAIVLDIVCQNARISKEFLHHFSAFPSDFAATTSQNQKYATIVEALKSWSPSFTSNWPKFFSNVCSRQYPPLIDEMVHELGVHSTILQGVLHSCCVSTLTVNRPATLCDAWRAVYQKNIGFYMNRLQKANTLKPVPPVQVQDENRYLILMYQRVSTSYSSHSAASASFPVTQSMNPQQTPYHPPSFHPLAPRPIPPPVANQQTTAQFPVVAPAIPPQIRPLPFQHQAHLPPQASIAPSNTAAPIATPMPSMAAHSATRQPVTVSTANFNNNSPLMPSYQAYPHPPVQHRIHPIAQPMAQPMGTPLFPPRNANALPPANPSPTSSLHLAHLRVVNVSLPNSSSGEPGGNLFYSLESFAVSPTPLDWNQYNFQLSFTLFPDQYAALPRPLYPPNTCHITQGVVDRTKIYQIRCVRSTNNQPLTEENWVMAECSWPTAIYIHVNGEEHFFRRKFHFGKDLPVSINRALRCGINEVKVALISTPEERKGSTFAIAVEVIDVASYKRTREAIQTLPLSQSLDNIVKRLTNNASDSDELCVIDDFITLPLIDPFMARIFDVPVRTVSCKYSECFDLDTFLNTRLSRDLKGPQGMAEDWKCPICNQDARPKRLIIDQFLVHVREELAQRKQLDDVTAIKIRADRSWDVITRQTSCVKAEQTGVATTITIPSSPKAAQAPPEIIELD